MSELVCKHGGLSAVCLVFVAVLAAPGCIVQTGTRPAVVEDSGPSDAAVSDGDASGGGVDADDTAGGGVDAAKDAGGTGVADADATAVDASDTSGIVPDIVQVEDATDAGATAGDADAAGVDDTADGAVDDAVGDTADGGVDDASGDTADGGVDDASGDTADGGATDTGGTESPDGDVTLPSCEPADPGTCDDGDACSVDACVAGLGCVHTALDCQDGDPCTDDSCNPATGCVNVANTEPCDDGNACTDGDACEEGGCHPGQAVSCADGNLCTDDACDEVAGCHYLPNKLDCLDGNPCTLGDSCAGGICTGGREKSCDDGNPCTDDACVDGCVHTPNTAACDDGDPCTVGDACLNGECEAGAPMDCSDTDGNPCTGKVCDSGVGTCVPEALDGAPCDDGSGPESGMCAGSACKPAKCGDTSCPALPGYGRSCSGAVCRYARLEPTEGWSAHDVWVWVPPGSFTMGSPELDDEGQPEERPAHVVTLAYGFFMQETEITVAEYAACELDGGCSAPMVGANGDPNHPQSGIDRQQAEDVCAWLGGRLPTEAEWEYAANGPGMHRRFPWGEDEPSCAAGGTAVFKYDPGPGCPEAEIFAVGSKSAGAAPTGALDMAGNVAEWVEDCYHWTYDGAPANGNGWNEVCGDHGVVRGGSYESDAPEIRSASRANLLPKTQSLTVGARCVRTAEPRCGGITCPHLDEYSASCNAKDYCEYHRLEQTADWQQWDQWIYVPPGSFSMGAPAPEASDTKEGPVHTVTFAEGYLVAKYETSVAQYEACIGDGSCTGASTEGWDVGGWGLSTSDNGRSEHPQNGLTWNQASQLCAWSTPGGRLPSEAEWEHAATGPTHSKYPWGDLPEPTCTNETAVFAEVGDPAGYGCGSADTMPNGTSPIGSKPAGASAVGALDMAGNVAEWVEDIRHNSYEVALSDGSGYEAAPSDGSAWAEHWESASSHHVIRGGGFNSESSDLRTASRWFAGKDHFAYMGARCARPLPHTCGTTECPVLGGYEVSCNVANHCEYRRFAPSEPWHAWDQWIYVPPGSFPMGSPETEEGHVAWESPLHVVSFASGFLMAKYETVVAQYEACVIAGVCTEGSTADWDGEGWGLNTSSAGREDHPQNGLTWQQAADVCGWVAPDARLPSEAEWEYAAKGAEHRKYPWGDAPEPTCSGNTAVFNESGTIEGYGCGTGGTWPSGSKEAGASAIGALDMAGNVADWVEDCWHDQYDGAPTDGVAWTKSCISTDRVRRGGTFASAAHPLRSARRAVSPAAGRYADTGARCVREICLSDTDCDDGDPLTCDACKVGECHHDCTLLIPAGPAKVPGTPEIPVVAGSECPAVPGVPGTPRLPTRCQAPRKSSQRGARHPGSPMTKPPSRDPGFTDHAPSHAAPRRRCQAPQEEVPGTPEVQ